MHAHATSMYKKCPLATESQLETNKSFLILVNARVRVFCFVRPERGDPNMQYGLAVNLLRAAGKRPASCNVEKPAIVDALCAELRPATETRVV